MGRGQLIRFAVCGVAVLSVALGACPPKAFAHKASDAYVTLTGDPHDPHLMHGQWDIALRDLDHAIGLDADGDGAITWGEVRARHADIAAYALARLTIKSDGIVCPLALAGPQKIDTHTDGAYSVLFFTVNCDKEVPNKLSIGYRLFFDIDPSHRGIITLHHRGHTSGGVLSPDHPVTAVNLNAPDRWRQFKSFVRDGIWHIWTGYDHLLFVLSLLLPAVLVRAPRPETAWLPAPSWWRSFVEIAKVVSAFTVSHTCTLTLAVLGIVTIPDRIVESGIALSVMIAAANNLYPLVRKRLWLVAFGFGFIHGLGFASALSGLQLPPGAMAASLGGFNAGVEIGQEAVVIALMPCAFLVRRTYFYRYWILRGGSLLILLIAGGWLIQRAFDIQISALSAMLPN